MAVPVHLTALLLIGVSLGMAQDPPCTLPFQTTPGCTCASTNITCSRSLAWDKVPEATTSLTITGAEMRTLNNKNQPTKALPSLRTLNLAGNGIDQVSRAWFAHTWFPALEVLVLDRNRLTLRDPRLFTRTAPTLRMLSLDGGLDANQTLVVENLKSALNQTHLPGLETLRLDNNPIGILFPFSQLAKTVSFPSLRLLSLHNISLISFLKGTFPKRVFPRLEHLDLSSNQISSLNQGLDDLRNLTGTTVDFAGNPFYCNCRLAHFQAWLNQTSQVPDKGALVCQDAVDKASVGQPLLEVHLLCEDSIDEINVDDEMRPSYIILSVILAMVGLLALAVLYMRRNDIKDYCTELYTNTKEAFNSRQGYDDINRVRRDTPEMVPTEV